MCGLSESMGTMAWCWEYQVTEVDSNDEVEQTVSVVTVLFAWHNREGAVQSADS